MSAPSALKYIVARPKLYAFLRPIAAKYADLAGYRKMGLMYEDLIREESPTVQLALKRLPPKIAYDRAFRIRRAVQCSVTQKLLPKEEWIKEKEDLPYLSPYIEEIEKEEEERRMFDSMKKA